MLRLARNHHMKARLLALRWLLLTGPLKGVGRGFRDPPLVKGCRRAIGACHLW